MYMKNEILYWIKYIWNIIIHYNIPTVYWTLSMYGILNIIIYQIYKKY